MSVSVSVVYYLSEAGQRAAALAGIPPVATQVLDLPATPELVSIATPTAAGGLLLGIGGSPRVLGHNVDVTSNYAGGRILPPYNATLQLGANRSAEGDYGSSPVPAPRFDAPLTTAAEVIAAVIADREQVAVALAERAGAVAARRAAEAQRSAAAEADTLAKQRVALPGALERVRGIIADADALGLDRIDSWRTLAAELPEPGTLAARELLDTYSVKKFADVVAAARKRQEMLAWVATHGSERLRGAIELGIEADRLYEDERLALERPGWVFDRDLRDWPEEDVRNPTEAAIALFREARAVEPTAVIVWTGWLKRYAVGRVKYMGRNIWLDRWLDRDGATGPLRELGGPLRELGTDDDDDT